MKNWVAEGIASDVNDFTLQSPRSYFDSEGAISVHFSDLPNSGG